MTERKIPEEIPIPVFDPLQRQIEEVWFPGDEPTSLLVSGQHIWEDILRMLGLRKRCKDDYERKLLLKYVVLETVSMLAVMDGLQRAVMTAEVYTPPEPPLYRGISDEEKAEALELWTAYSNAKKAVGSELTQIRNKVAAHRDVSNWRLAMDLWDKVDPSLVEALLFAIPPAFNHSKELNIFEWNIRHDDGTITILGGPVVPGVFSAAAVEDAEREPDVA